MRILVAMALVCLVSCAGEKLVQAPPAGVDFTGHWKLNEADSDDPQRLLLAQNSGQSSASGGSGGGGGRGGRGGGRGGVGGPGLGGPGGPAMPSVSAMGESLRWPGRQLEIKQVAGVVAFTSDGGSVVCQPMEGGPHRRTHGDGDSSRRDAPSRSRDAPPPHCGWAEKILIVENRDSDDDHPPFEEHFGLSDDGRRLVEIVAFKGGRSSGFTMSRVWDRID